MPWSHQRPVQCLQVPSEGRVTSEMDQATILLDFLLLNNSYFGEQLCSFLGMWNGIGVVIKGSKEVCFVFNRKLAVNPF